MRSLTMLFLAAAGLTAASVGAAQEQIASQENWPQWRGPLATGEAPHGEPPLDWDEAAGTNIQWRTAIPGRGHSTPIVWGDKVFLTTAIPFGDPLPPRPSTAPGNHDNLPVTHRHRFAALAIHRSSGKFSGRRSCANPCRTSRGITPEAWPRTPP